MDPDYRERMARQIPLIGKQGQNRVARAKLSIVGCGGNGSMLVWLCVLAGFLRLRLFDPDRLESHNRNRFAFARLDNIGGQKVCLAQAEITQCFPEARVEAFAEDIRSPGVWDRASDCDFLVDTTDSDETRHSLSQRCAEARLPLLSLGSGFVIRDGQTKAAGCRVNRAAPGDACLACQVLDHEPMEQAHVSLVIPNVIAASLALDMLLRSVTGYVEDIDDEDTTGATDGQMTSGLEHTSNCILFDLLHRRLYSERITPTPGCPWCRELNRSSVRS